MAETALQESCHVEHSEVSKLYSDGNINFPLNSNCVSGQFDTDYDLLQRSIRRKTIYDERVLQANDTR